MFIIGLSKPSCWYLFTHIFIAIQSDLQVPNPTIVITKKIQRAAENLCVTEFKFPTSVSADLCIEDLGWLYLNEDLILVTAAS